MAAVCATSGPWLYPIYFYALLSLVTNGLVLPFPPFSNGKGGGKDQLSLSSICPGNYYKAPAEREALPLVCNDAQHPGSRQKGALLLPKCARPCPGMPAGMPASAHLNGKKRDENPGGRQKQSERSPSDKRQQNINLVTKKRRNYSDHRTVTH